ncbi:SPL family radical SAM protein [Leptospira sp. GIMC2001]|uniref:SPL family radical SAM protein n=1 Tax=Leptospira sp. GIMC2001 TaxID=1513297 RepID=UPI002349CC1E|nr:radical SAM protein [Leptospira sp. GIMC2001]WCL49868.1 DNA photolyase [Leptospira sp. GIMC2001]
MNKLPPYSHIYIEKGAEKFPIAEKILAKFTRAEIIQVDNYKEIFNRPGQNFQFQKTSPKLILARKKDNFLYKGSNLAPDFGEENFYYNALILNCPFNCDYCYLQGMYNSGNIVIFVNLDDFFEETDKLLDELKRIYLCLSYDTDLLGMESVIGYCKEWIEFARLRPELILELRTKSANWKSIETIQPIPNAILAWTLSPQSVVERFEKKTASLNARLDTLTKALDKGWPVRICIDPILYFDGWQEEYRKLIQEIRRFDVLDRIREVSLGSFRMNRDFFTKVRKSRQDSILFHQHFETEDSATFYPLEIRENLVEFIKEELSQ